jgi:hypothetical protein
MGLKSARGGSSFSGCGAEGGGAAQVGKVGLRNRVSEQLFDHGEEVVQRADGPEGHGIGATSRTAGLG